MNTEKSIKHYYKHLTRKDRVAKTMTEGYTRALSREYSRSIVKGVRKEANRKLRRYKGEVTNYGWYKRFADVWNTVF